MQENKTEKFIEDDCNLHSGKKERSAIMKRWIILGTFFFVLNLCFILVICLNHAIRGQEDAVIMVQGAEAESLEGNLDTSTESLTDSSDKKDTVSDVVKNEEESKKTNDKQNAEKRVYLTFDDGPSKNTEKILDILKKYDIKATFFVIGREDDFSIEMYKRIVEEGHTLGMHSYSHDYTQIYKSKKAFFKDLQKIDNLLYKTTGEHAVYYRFPGGSSNTVSDVSMKMLAKELEKRGKVYFDWNAMNGDASGKSLTKKQMINNVLEDVEKYNTSVVLMHDTAGKDKTVEMLPALLDKLLKMDVALLPIDEETTLVQHVKAE